MGIIHKARRKFKATTDIDHQLPVASNLLQQDFSADKPHENGYQTLPTLKYMRFCNALNMALCRRKFLTGLLFILIKAVNIALGNTKICSKAWIGMQDECQRMLL